MGIPALPLPYGLRDVKLIPYATDTTLGTAVDLPASQTFSFSEAEEFEELRGDDGVIAIRGKGAVVNWSLEAGGISFEAWKVLAGGTLTESGVTPAEKKVIRKMKTDTRPYFKAEGQAISDSGGDVHGIVFKARASENIEGEFADGTFWVTSASGTAIPATVTADVDALYEFVQNETAVAIT